MTAALGPGDVVGGHRVVRRLGTGGMGSVYLAEHLTLGRPVALKLLAAHLADEAGFSERFAREARLAARLDHPNVVPVYDAGHADAGLWLTMRFVEGEDLGAALRGAGGRLPPGAAVRIVGEVAAGLDHAHAHGVIHRDVKPANVLLEAGPTSDGRRVLLADFGLTKELEGGDGLTRPGAVMGSVDYMAPEQVEGGPVDARTDVYALAGVLVTLLTGEPPFAGSAVARLYAHVNADPPRPGDVDPGLCGFDDVVARGMAKDRAERFATAGDLARAATAALAPAMPVPPGDGVPRPRPRSGATGPPGDERTEPSGPSDSATRVHPAAPIGRPPGPGPEAPRAAHTPRASGGVAVEGASGPGRLGAAWWRWAVVALLSLAAGGGIVALLATSGGGHDDGGPATRADRPERTTTSGARASRSATTSSSARRGARAGGADAERTIAVEGGGTIPPGSSTVDPSTADPLPGGAASADYVAPDGSWRGALARPGHGWRSPTQTVVGSGAIHRLSQHGPGGRLIVVDHTPTQPATFDAERDVVEQRRLGTRAFGPATGYRFRGTGFVGCRGVWCVDVPVNASPKDGPGWGVLVGDPDPEVAWATAQRVAGSIVPSG